MCIVLGFCGVYVIVCCSMVPQIECQFSTHFTEHLNLSFCSFCAALYSTIFSVAVFIFFVENFAVSIAAGALMIFYLVKKEPLTQWVALLLFAKAVTAETGPLVRLMHLQTGRHTLTEFLFKRASVAWKL